METLTLRGVLRGILYSHTCLDYVLQTSIDLMKENGFTQEKARSRRYTAQTITEVNYADDIAFLVNTPA